MHAAHTSDGCPRFFIDFGYLLQHICMPHILVYVLRRLCEAEGMLQHVEVHAKDCKDRLSVLFVGSPSEGWRNGRGDQSLVLTRH
jgi:hypothetical protein